MPKWIQLPNKTEDWLPLAHKVMAHTQQAMANYTMRNATLTSTQWARGWLKRVCEKDFYFMGHGNLCELKAVQPFFRPWVALSQDNFAKLMHWFGRVCYDKRSKRQRLPLHQILPDDGNREVADQGQKISIHISQTHFHFFNATQRLYPLLEKKIYGDWANAMIGRRFYPRFPKYLSILIWKHENRVGLYYTHKSFGNRYYGTTTVAVNESRTITIYPLLRNGEPLTITLPPDVVDDNE